VKPLSFMFMMRFWPYKTPDLVRSFANVIEMVTDHDGETNEADITTVLYLSELHSHQRR
jgi:hypothetical protein